MRLIATALNCLLLFGGLYAISQEGMPQINDDWFWLIVLMLLSPSINLAASALQKEESWLALYLKRKALEERKKIDELRGNA